MSKIDLGQTITILANIGVILGIIVLIVELDQNSDSQAFQARSLLLTARAADQRTIVENSGGIADIFAKARDGEELTWAESWRMTVHFSNVVHSFDAIYDEVLAGSLNEQDLPIAQWRGTFGAVPGLPIDATAFRPLR